MIKRKSNAQNIIIIILCILLLISIGFGVTYSYYNGKSNLVKGSITTANLSISLQGSTSDGTEIGQTTEFSISAPFGEEFLVPGNNLNNVQLNLFNKCNRKTYMVVVYTLSAIKNDKDKTDVTDQLTNTPAISFQDHAFDANSPWRPISYTCKNKANTMYTCLVGFNEFEGRGESDGVYINVLKPNSIKIPEQWNDILQNCSVTISITAYAIQEFATEDTGAYHMAILNAQTKYNQAKESGDAVAMDNALEEKSQAIANAVLEINKVDA